MKKTTLLVQQNYQLRGKALLAVLFAAGMLNTQLPVLAEIKSESTTDLLIEQIASQKQISPELRAYYLLRIASGYLAGGDKDKVEAPYRSLVNGTTHSFPFREPRREAYLVSWADQISSEEQSASSAMNAQGEAKSDSKSIPDQNVDLADMAISSALLQLEHDTKWFAKLNLYFIASRLFRKSGNTDGVRSCNKVLEKAFQACEENSLPDPEQIRAASSVLNSMANGFIQVYIPIAEASVKTWLQQKPSKPFKEEDFKKSEELKLKAIALEDQLGPQNEERRRAHRDLSLWYMKFGKLELAEKEKQILFELVGFKDDSLLYPQSGSCGSLLWFQKEKVSSASELCGMG